MNVLLLSPYPWALRAPIEATDGVIRDSMAREFDPDWPDLIVVYGYRYIIRDCRVLKKFAGRIWNLHISYLPYGKGANPVKRAALEGFPMGVTIHEIDAGLDSGPIVAQRRLDINMRERFGTSWDQPESINEVYWEHRAAIEALFANVWPVLVRRLNPI